MKECTGEKKTNFSMPEVKILLLAVMLSICGVFILARFSFTLLNPGEYSQLVLKDGLCHLHGDNSGSACAERRELLPQAVTSIFTYFLIFMIPITNVVFVISQPSQLRKKMKRFCCTFQIRKCEPNRPNPQPCV